MVLIPTMISGGIIVVFHFGILLDPSQSCYFCDEMEVLKYARTLRAVLTA